MKEFYNAMKQRREIQIPRTNNHVSTSYLQLIITALITVIFLTWYNFACSIHHASTEYYIWGNVSCIIFATLWSLQYNIPTKIATWMTRIAIPLLPLLTVCIAEIPNSHHHNYPLNVFLVFSFYTWCYLFGFAVTGSIKRSVYVLSPIFWLLSAVNYYILQFRGDVFLPFDIMYADTAATVTKSYNFAPNHKLLLSFILLFVLIGVTRKLTSKIRAKKHTLIKRIIAGLLTVCLFGSYFITDTLSNIGFKPDFYEPGYSASRFGVTMNFWMNLKYITVNEPNGYKAEDIDDIMLNIIGDASYEATSQKRPHVICIMNEAFSDIAVRGQFSTNMDYMPFVRNLTKNTIKGNLYVPVLGNGTCNSELEFLTGYSTTFAPAGSKPYSLYIHDTLPSLAHYFNALGYQTTAFHPYYKANWNRPNVYQHMGFQNYYGMEDFLNEDTVALIKNFASLNEIENALSQQYPGKDYLMRQYLNDEFNHDRIIELYESAKNSNRPLFLFNITMQNHGGYNPEGNFEPQIHITNADGSPRENVDKTNEYLSLVYESDKQIQRLIEYFEMQDEPVIVLMFGDHQPSTGDHDFFLEIAGLPYDSAANIQQRQNKYITPFFIWANYDIEEEQLDMLSANYLGSYLLKTMGTEMPLYHQYLLELSKILPVINTQGYIDHKGQYFTYNAASPYQNIIKSHEYVCYNLMFDQKHQQDSLYYSQ